VLEFEAWVEARSLQLARTAYLLVGDRGLAEDLLQDTLARVAERWRTVSGRGSPDAYARKVMFHLAVDWWRRRRARPELLLSQPPDLSSGAAAGGLVEDELVARMNLRAALSRLTPRQRAVLVLRFFEDCSETQAAELLGCSVNTVKSQTRHALARLRQLAPDLLELAPSTEVPK
jgi:RNA polymerase sigma-70 factor (sigma-E family)